jgi:hypothetical protein
MFIINVSIHCSNTDSLCICIMYNIHKWTKKKSKYKINVQYTYMNKKIIKKKKKKQNIVNYAILVK